ncbi:hypothetical protein ACJX0J_030017, partial [Zea mays]
LPIAHEAYVVRTFISQDYQYTRLQYHEGSTLQKALHAHKGEGHIQNKNLNFKNYKFEMKYPMDLYTNLVALNPISYFMDSGGVERDIRGVLDAQVLMESKAY